jgi:hypothetical protein
MRRLWEVDDALGLLREVFDDETARRMVNREMV